MQVLYRLSYEGLVNLTNPSDTQGCFRFSRRHKIILKPLTPAQPLGW
jgi:hypothetical protein